MTHYFSGKEGHCLLNHHKMAVNSDFRLCARPEGRKERRESILQMIPENSSHQIFSTFLLSPGTRRTSVCEKGQRHSPCTLSTQIYWKRSSRGHKPLLSKPSLQLGAHVVPVASCYSLLLLPWFVWGMWAWKDHLPTRESCWALWLCKREKLWKVTETEVWHLRHHCTFCR